MKKYYTSILLLFLFVQFVDGQVSYQKNINHVTVSKSQAKLLGKTKSVRTSTLRPSTTKEERARAKRDKQVPDNFKNRRNKSKAVHLDKEHQGVDPVLQKDLSRMLTSELEVLANFNGVGTGSPNDPTGDVDGQYYVQAVNSTTVGVYNLDGSTEMIFSMSTLWSQLGQQSLGDPIILYDEIEDRWFLTEFTNPANILIGVSATNDPLGEYYVYIFTTPNFPDYPKYAITKDHLSLSTNEEGGGTLTHYFLDKAALVAGERQVDFQRVTLVGAFGTEQGFYVSTPADLNGTNPAFNSSPIMLRLNDSSWSNGPDQDQIELYHFNIDYDDSANTTVDQTSIIVSPFDAFPCSQSGPGFQCIPQMGGGGLDGIPEVIMNIPHQRNFGTHESIVLSFVTDATNGQNRAAIRWVELRRTADTDWSLYQEGTFGLDDGLDRFMSSIAIDDNGNICLGYNVSSLESFAGIRATGRNDGDPLGMMTYDELIIREGLSTIISGGRFGDYSQMSVSKSLFSDFWFTTEYAGQNVTQTNITGLRFERDSFDLALTSFISPVQNSAATATEEMVTVEVANAGLTPIVNYTLTLFQEETLIDELDIFDIIEPGETIQHTFNNTIDLSEIRTYELSALVSNENDINPINDSLTFVVSKLANREASIAGFDNSVSCEEAISGQLELTNLGGDSIRSAVIGVVLNGVPQANILVMDTIGFNQTSIIDYSYDQDVTIGENELTVNIHEINGEANDFNTANNEATITTEVFDPENFITINLITDQFPLQTFYSITSQTTGELILESPILTEPNVIIEDRLCLDLDDCYTIRLVDSFGDGICCDNGNGSLVIFDALGNVLAFNDGQFGSEVEINFCGSLGECMITAEIDITPVSSSSADDGTILITPSNGVAPYSFSIDGGASSQDGNLFTDLPAGDYDIVVTDINNVCIYEETVTVGLSTSTYFVEGNAVEVDILPNPTDGVFKINIENLPIKENFIDIEIYDLSGKRVQQREIGKYDNTFVGTFSLYAYPAGTYFVRIKSSGINFLERVVKQ